VFKPGRTAATLNETSRSQETRSYVVAGRALPVPSWRTLGIAGAVVAGILVIGALAWLWNASQQQRGSAVYADVLTRHRAAEGPQATPEARSAAMTDLERVLGEYPSNLMAPQAAFMLGNLRFTAGQYERARAAYQIAISRGGAGTMGTLARAGVGYTWEAEGKLPEAMKSFEAALADLKPTSFYYEELLSALARTQERAGQKDAAVATYRRVLRDVPRSPRIPEVRGRLAALGVMP
jgi:tetratricopeptide (TPR) repeat protein